MQLNGSYGKEKSYVRDIFFGHDYYYFQNSGASNDDFFLNAFKTLSTTFHALNGRTMTMSLLHGSYLSAKVREEGKIWLHWYFRQQNFL